MDWTNISEEELLKMRLCELPVAIEGTWLKECIHMLYQELDSRGLSFKPECYLADEWLTPEDQPVIGIPFYLAHPVLTRLEKKMMLEAEGETKDWCMRLLRHEAGHAICYAYGLNKKRKWKDMFGSSQQEYLETYRFRPYSKNYVRHLEGFYAQYHPDEDFVETFAVWLSPQMDWAKKYEGWKALKKLQYVNQLMTEIKGKEPRVKTGKKYWHIKSSTMTLKHFYKKKRRLRAEDFPDFHDDNLKKIFTVKEPPKSAMRAQEIITRYQKNILNDVARWTGEKKYVINDLVKTVAKRAKALRLATDESETLVIGRLTSYITTLVMNYMYTGWYRGNRKIKRK